MVVADKPSMEVENNLAGPHVATRFRETVRHGKSGVLFIVIRPNQLVHCCPKTSETEHFGQSTNPLQGLRRSDLVVEVCERGTNDFAPAYWDLNLKTVVLRKVSPGRRIVEGKFA